MSSLPFIHRHLGNAGEGERALLDALELSSLDELVEKIIPDEIRLERSLELPEPLGEQEALEELRGLLGQNSLKKNFIGQGYHGTILPPVIRRHILENPGWYTAYTPYQPEISQGRLEMLLHYQTMIAELTGLPIANASLLDEGTAAAEAVTMAKNSKPKGQLVFVDQNCHPQTIAVLKTRLAPLGIAMKVGDWTSYQAENEKELIACLVQYPDTKGAVYDYEAFAEKVHSAQALLIVAADPLALTLLKEPGSFGADICVGTTQRYGIPLGFGGPHAAYIACTEKLTRKLPGRLVGISRDAHGNPAYRLALQTREQHIRRDKATSNICTAQALLAIMATAYGMHHGAKGLKSIAKRINKHATTLAHALNSVTGIEVLSKNYFDTVLLHIPEKAEELCKQAEHLGYNLRLLDGDSLTISCDELTSDADLEAIISVLGGQKTDNSPQKPSYPKHLERKSDFLRHEMFHQHESETSLMRYLHRLAQKDLSLNQSMIPLGSCTMKLNAAVEMMPLTWPEIANLHPFAPNEQTTGARKMLDQLAEWLAQITGFAAVSLQPNAGAQGEYAGLLAIRQYHLERGDPQRNICLIPTSAHGTNPASAVMAGFEVVPILCNKEGNIDQDDLYSKVEKYSRSLGAFMVTYPSTHGVYEEGITGICETIHRHGGQVYLDGANLNAQVGFTSPAQIGADVCHLNLHKTFCIPHGGGGPGVGPIGVAAHLVPYLPSSDPNNLEGAVSAAPYGSASINTISWLYIRMAGATGLKNATKHALLTANYLSRKLQGTFPILYSGSNNLVAHELILDPRELCKQAKINVEDIAKRLIDYGFHAPTMSWPVPGTLMIEPTESEPKQELDRFIAALQGIYKEIKAIIESKDTANGNLLKNAPHTAQSLTADHWEHSYTREQAAYPAPSLREHKYWVPVGRIEQAYGDRNLMCTCSSVEELAVR